MRVALIPVKELSIAKARLAPVLDEGSRRSLTLALFQDVLSAAIECPSLDGVAVTTRDPDVLALAASRGAQPLPLPGGLNEALTSSALALAERRATRLVVLAADLPFAGPQDISAVTEAAAEVAVAPSKDGGTNAMALAPGAIQFRFGPESAALHEAEARKTVLSVKRLDIERLAFDVDTPDDLARLRAAAAAGEPVGPSTREAIQRLRPVTEPA